MKIESIDVFQVTLPYSGGTYLLSGNRDFGSFDATIVSITADNGIQGWGESTPFGASYVAAHAKGVRAGIDEMATMMLGQDPRHLDRINETMDAGLAGHHHAKAALDVACWDIFGKAVGMPVCDLLGGRTRQVMPLISSIHSGMPEDMRKRVASHRSDGYLGHSIKIGASESEGGPALDAERIVACLADRKEGEYFLADANGGLTVESALRMLELLPGGLDFVLEAPCASWNETLNLRKRCRIPIVLDELIITEQDVVTLIVNDAADGIGLKISKNGGLTRARRQRDMCIAAGLTMSIQDTVGSDFAFAAIVHLAQTVPAHLLRCMLDVRGMVTVKTADFMPRLSNGGISAPDAPGLGVVPKLDVLGEPVMRYD